MKKLPLKPFSAAEKILEALPEGILMTTRAGDVTDTMVIGWGEIGYDWYMPVFTAFVRDSRYTKQLVDENPCFTINVPVGKNPDFKKIIQVCGTRSGRDIDKFKECGLDLVETDFPVPAIAQFPLTLECEVIHVQRQDEEQINAGEMKKYYPKGDYHTAYTAKITACYLLKED